MKNNATATNAVIYARYSSHNQTERSIEGQLQDCMDYAERCGLTVIDEYIDRAMTGTNDSRDDFQRMIADASKGRFSFVIVYKLDRFARNRYDSAIYKAKLKKYGVRVVSAMEQITDTPEGIILESVLEGMAEYYSANLSQNVKRGLRVAMQNKTFLGGTPPYGFKVIEKRVVPDENEHPILQWIFKEYARGVPKKEIIAQLNAKGYKSKRGRAFTLNSLQHVLNNKKYLGIVEYEGQEVRGVYPELIDRETFDKVQEKLAHHKRAPGENTAKVEYLLRGKAFCGCCGSPMVGDSGTAKNGTRHHYYTCAKRKRRAGTCHKLREKKDFIEWYVVEQTVEYVLQPKRMEYIAEKLESIYKKEFGKNKVHALEKQIAECSKEIEKLVEYALQANSKSVIATVDQKADALDRQRAELTAEVEKIKLTSKSTLTKKDVLKWLKSFCNGDLFDIEFRKRIIDTFINSIFLFDDKIIIYYNIKNGKQVSYMEMLDSLEEKEIVFDDEINSSFNPISPPHKSTPYGVLFLLAERKGLFSEALKGSLRQPMCEADWTVVSRMSKFFRYRRGRSKKCEMQSIPSSRQNLFCRHCPKGQ